MAKWTPEQDAQLTKLWNDGMSAAQIAAAIGNGYSRCSVIGRKDRLRLGPRDPSIHGRVALRSTRSTEKKLFVPPKDAPPEPEAIGAFGDGGCKWPVGQPMDLLSCGQPRHKKYPYCEAHCARAFARPHNATA